MSEKFDKSGGGDIVLDSDLIVLKCSHGTSTRIFLVYINPRCSVLTVLPLFMATEQRHRDFSPRGGRRSWGCWCFKPSALQTGRRWEYISKVHISYVGWQLNFCFLWHNSNISLKCVLMPQYCKWTSSFRKMKAWLMHWSRVGTKSLFVLESVSNSIKWSTNRHSPAYCQNIFSKKDTDGIFKRKAVRTKVHFWHYFHHKGQGCMLEWMTEW